MADHSGKTEPATQRRLEKARKEGQFPSAREFVSALQFMAFLALAGAFSGTWLDGFRRTTRALLKLGFSRDVTPQGLTAVLWGVFRSSIMPLLLGGAAIALATLAVRLITTRFGVSLKRLAPDLSRLSPLAKLKELPRQNTSAFIQALILTPIFLWAAYAICREKLDLFLELPLRSVETGSRLLGASVLELFRQAAAVFFIFGSVDLIRQIRRHQNDLRMSRQDIRDESKEMEGNPQIKAKIRRIQRDRARRNMMKEVPTATAVVVNPTHFAVAIRYHVESMAAPLVVAKGKNYLALRIRAKAVENQVPIIENPPLARALYQSVEVGQEIPPQLYRAVAEVLAYIFKVMGGRPQA
jgi:flagellar biosynthesis protein FlhB